MDPLTFGLGVMILIAILASPFIRFVLKILGFIISVGILYGLWKIGFFPVFFSMLGSIFLAIAQLIAFPFTH